jgi:hypothetical protein
MGRVASAHRDVRILPADLKEGGFRGMQNQKAGFGMLLRESYTTGTTTQLQLEEFSCNFMFEDFPKSVKKIQLSLKSDKNNGTLDEDR